MNPPRKPIFGFLWATPDPNAPVDAAYHQIRPIRITARGPVRLLWLWLATVLTVLFTATAVTAALAAPVPAAVLGSAVICATACFLVLRGWVVGTFVSDQAIRIETVFRRVEIPWPAVAAVITAVERGPFIGMPLPVAGKRVAILLPDGRRIGTHVYAASPDLWLRPESFDVARLRLEHWREQA